MEGKTIPFPSDDQINRFLIEMAKYGFVLLGCDDDARINQANRDMILVKIKKWLAAPDDFHA